MRLRTVGPNRVVARLWINRGQEYARNPYHNFYFNYEVIYSYGVQYPVATFLGNGTGKENDAILINSLKAPSPSTNFHKSAVETAIFHNSMWDREGNLIAGHRIFHVPLCHYSKPYANHITEMGEAYRKYIDLAALQCKRSRVNRRWRYTSAIRIMKEAKRFAEYFSIDLDTTPRTVTLEELDLLRMSIVLEGHGDTDLERYMTERYCVGGWA